MYFGRYLTLAASAAVAVAQTKGFNYGSTNSDGSAKSQADFTNEFTTAANLVGTSGFTSARLYTMIQAGTANLPISAIPAAIATKTSLLLGLWASAGQDNFNNELAALSAAISQYGSAFTDLVVGISVGSEDLYRITPTGIANMAGVGAGPDILTTYITQVRNLIIPTILNGKPVGHVDTWTAYVNSSNNALISACDFLGVDAYPYFETTLANSIGNGKAQFYSAYDQTVAVAQGKPVWVTETGWPLSGPTENLAVPSIANSKQYWDDVGCSLFGSVNTWWYTLNDGTPSPSFGITGSSLSTTPAFDLTCPASNSGTSLASSAQATSTDAASSINQAQSSATTIQELTTLVTSATTAAQSPDTTVHTAVSSAPSGIVSATQPSVPTFSAASCPAALTGTWEFPHLIIPVDKNQPSTAAGSSYFGTFNDHISSCFNFDLPSSYAGKTCSLVFLFPTQDQLSSSSFDISGTGGLDIYELTSSVTEATTYSTVPGGSKIGSILDVKPGNSYVVASHECAAGSRVSFEFEATGSLALNYFQNSASSPIGAYITVC